MDAVKKMFFQTIWDPAGQNPEKEPLLQSSGDAKSIKRRDYKDSAFSWLMALDIFFINFVVQGMGRVAAILYVDFMQVFHVQRQTASAPYSVQQSTRRLFGPVVGMLGQRFGVAAVTVMGCLIAAISCAACYFTDDMTWITISWGAVYGIGAAFVGTVNLIVIDQYFTKYRSSAYGFSISGTCLGAIFLPAFFDMILEKYGVHGTFLLMGSIILIAVPVAMLLREEPEVTKEANEGISIQRSFSEIDNSSEFHKKHNIFLSSGENSNSFNHSSFHGSNNSDTVLAKRRLSFTTLSSGKDAKRESSFERDAIIRPESYPQDGNFEESETLQAKQIAGKQECAKSSDDLETAAKFSGENSKSTDAKFAESKCSEDSNAEKSTETSSEVNPLVELEISNDLEVSRKSLEEYVKNIPSTSATKETYGPAFPACNKATEDTASFSKSNPVEAPLKKFKKRKRVPKSKKRKYTTPHDNDSLSLNRHQNAKSYKNEIDFNVFHNNTDLVIDLLTHKIPLSEEGTLPTLGEVTQSSLESSDTQFIFKQLRKIENQLQLPCNQVEQFLSEIQEKVRRFNNLINADRDQFIKEKKLSFESKELAYKDIQNTTITKPDYTIEVSEYSFEIPVDLYIPVKLQEFHETNSEHVASLHPGDKRVFEVVHQLKKLHAVMFRQVPSFECSFENNEMLLPGYSGELNKSTASKKPPAAHQVTFKEQMRTALKLHLNPMFLLVCLCRALSMISFFPVVASVVDFALDKGLSRSQAIYAVSTLSTGDLVGRIGTGWITDKGFVSDKNYMALALILQGVTTAALPLQFGPALLLPTLGIFAVFQGSLLMKHPVVLTKYVKKSEKYIALGFINFFAGILSLFIPYYIGYFRDYLGSYDGLYFINGGLSGFLGCMWLLEPLLLRFVPSTEEGENAAVPNFDTVNDLHNYK